MAPLLPTGESLDLATVLLRHVLPDGSAHFDWLIQPTSQPETPLASFRLATRLDTLKSGQWLQALRIADHRAAYLSYEGPISGNRGTVRRIASGRVIRCQGTETKLSLTIRWTDRCQDLQLIEQELSCWAVISCPQVV